MIDVMAGVGIFILLALGVEAVVLTGAIVWGVLRDIREGK
jgi:hypothetical protein